MHRLRVACLVTAIAVFLVGRGEATLIGDTVNCSENLNVTECSPASATVGSGPEFALAFGFDRFTIDVQDSAIVLDVVMAWSGSPTGRFTISDLDWVNDPEGEITWFYGWLQ